MLSWLCRLWPRHVWDGLDFENSCNELVAWESTSIDATEVDFVTDCAKILLVASSQRVTTLTMNSQPVCIPVTSWRVTPLVTWRRKNMVQFNFYYSFKLNNVSYSGTQKVLVWWLWNFNWVFSPRYILLNFFLPPPLIRVYFDHVRAFTLIIHYILNYLAIVAFIYLLTSF